MKERRSLGMAGWREWVSLPELGLEELKVKVDTGATTSALHAFDVQSFEEDGRQKVRFMMHPIQDDTETERECIADVVDVRKVKDSGGHIEERFVILSMVCMGNRSWPIEITLTNRDNMNYRMLLGRQALTGRYAVDSASSYLCGKPETGDIS